jgi:hypothetical protein
VRARQQQRVGDPRLGVQEALSAAVEHAVQPRPAPLLAERDDTFDDIVGAQVLNHIAHLDRRRRALGGRLQPLALLRQGFALVLARTLPERERRKADARDQAEDQKLHRVCTIASIALVACTVGACRPAPPPATATAPLRVTAAGDLQLGDGLTTTPLGDPALLDGGLRLVNLEGPLTARRDGVREHFAFAPARAGWLAGRVDVVALANNHALDQGLAGRDDTVRALAAAGVAAAWEGHDARVRGVTVIARAFAPDADLDGPAAAALVTAVAQAPRPTLVSLHWGHTGLLLPDAAQRRLAARLVAAGASAVLGHGPHAPQGVERRGRAVIAYSLGNFAFGCDCTDGADAYVLAFTLAPDGAAGDVTLVPLVAGLQRPPGSISQSSSLSGPPNSFSTERIMAMLRTSLALSSLSL